MLRRNISNKAVQSACGEHEKVIESTIGTTLTRHHVVHFFFSPPTMFVIWSGATVAAPPLSFTVCAALRFAAALSENWTYVFRDR